MKNHTKLVLLAAAHVAAAGYATETAPPPVLPGANADPHIVCYDGVYYIYPTTDGFDGWKSSSFSCWSSRDLRHWKNEGVILDFRKDLRWADDRAWAPCIARRNGKYYFYFTAEGQIGVAVSDRPTGPFEDPLGKPLIARGSYDCWVIGDTYHALSGGGDPQMLTSGDLGTWTHVGAVFHEDYPGDLGSTRKQDVSCANMFRIGDRWMLLCIDHALGARYFLGDFKDGR